MSFQSSTLQKTAELFCGTSPHRAHPFSKRNWGGVLHSICSYQGKLKPAIAHFLVKEFTNQGDVVLDPMSGVGTIPLEARRLRRVGYASDLSPLAYAVSSAKLEALDLALVAKCVDDIEALIKNDDSVDDSYLGEQARWGLNRSISEYFHRSTLREILIARKYFAELVGKRNASVNVVLASLMHILHGNRPYALSRNSHSITPFSPTGEYQYRPLVAHLRKRLNAILPSLVELAECSMPGMASQADFRNLKFHGVDAVITSPPFSHSVRFWSSNWMRLWFAGWEPASFKSEPARYLESEQKESYAPYREFARSIAGILNPGGRLILHLGETVRGDMASEIAPMISENFKVTYVGRENVTDTESHGITDKGSTFAHVYLFAELK